MTHRVFRFSKGLSLTRVNHRIPKLVTVGKDLYKLKGGPFNGHKIAMTDGTSIKFCVIIMWRVDHDTTGVGPYRPVRFRGCYRTAICAAGNRSGIAEWVGTAEPITEEQASGTAGRESQQGSDREWDRHLVCV